MREISKGFTPLEKATDKAGGGKDIAADGGLMPPSAGTVREQSSLTGFTLIELVVGLAIGAVIVLIIGVISSSGIGSYEKSRKEAEAYNDIFYGFSLVQRNVRQALIANADDATDTLTADNFVFKKNGSDFIYTDTATNADILILKMDTSLGETLDFSVSPQSGKLFNVTLSGQKVINLGYRKVTVPFNLTTQAMERN